MKTKLLYAFEGLAIGFFGHQIWHDVLLPIIVSAVCAVVTLLIQFFGKQALNSWKMNRKFPKFRQNGKQ